MNNPKDPLLDMWGEIRFLRQLVFLHEAELRALRDFASAHIADLSQVDREKAATDLRAMISKNYDEVILKLGDRYPNVADDIDVRKKLSRNESTLWFFQDYQSDQ